MSNTALTETMRAAKLPGRATTEGQQFEYKLAGLINARANRKSGLVYQLATNVAGAEPCDDIVLRLAWQGESQQHQLTYLVQLKHNKERKGLTRHAFLCRTGDFALNKYFLLYKNLREQHLVSPSGHSESKEFLRSNQQDDYRFIIYTTRIFKPSFVKCEEHNIDRTNGPSAVEESCSYPHSDLFSCDEASNGYSFSKRDRAVWNLMNGQIDEDIYRHEFLPRFRIYGGQCSAFELDDIIRQELQTYFQIDNLQTERILRQYLICLSAWWESDVGDVWTNETNLLEDIMIQDINKLFNRKNWKDKIIFSQQACQQIEEMIRNNRVLVIGVPGVATAARCWKLSQVLERTFTNYKVLKVNEEALHSFSLTVLKISKKLYDATIVVINAKTLDDGIMEIVAELQNNTKCKTIILIGDLKEVKGSKGRPEMCLYEDKWSLGQLDSPEDFLNCQMAFQGRAMALRDLYSVWPTMKTDVDAALLLALLDGNATLGPAPLVDLDEEDGIYIERTLQHRPVVDIKVLHLENCSDHFVLSGFSGEYIETLKAKRDSVRKAKENFSTTDHGTWHILLSLEHKTAEDYKREFRKICNMYQSSNIHHLHFIEGCVVWMEAYGSSSLITAYLPSSVCNPGFLCSHRYFPPWHDKLVILTGPPGIGKTTYITSLVRKGDLMGWSILVTLAAHKQLLSEMPLPQEIEHFQIVQVLAQAVGAEHSSSPFSTNAFLKALLDSGTMSVYLDGVDELGPSLTQKLLQIIKLLQTTSVNRVLITARSHLAEDLRKVFKFEPLQIQPFSEEDQINHIHRLLLRKGVLKDQASLSDVVRKAFHIINKKTIREEYSMCGIPLHTRLIAESYNEWLNVTNISVLKLYKIFVEEKFNIYVEKYLQKSLLKDTPLILDAKFSFIEKHKRAALVTVPGLEDLARPESSRKITYETINTGIMSFKSGVPVFIHQTFAEYFAALWFLDNIQDITHRIWDKMTPTTQHFFNAMCADGKPLHEAVIAGDMQEIKTISDVVEDRDEGGRTALHVAAILGNAEACRLLLHAGSDSTARDAVLRWLPLQYADAGLFLEAVDVLLGEGSEGAVQKLLQRNEDGGILRTAARKGMVNLVKFFVAAANYPSLCAGERKKCTNKGAANNAGVTPLHLAASEGHSDVVRVLCEAGAAVNVRTRLDETALHLACEKGREDVVSILLEKGASTDATSRFSEQTPLHVAAEMGHMDVCERLLGANASIDATDRNGFTALHWASMRGRDDVTALLISRGSAVDAVGGSTDETPLHLSSREGHIAVVKQLIAAGADVEALNGRGLSPLHVALDEGRVHVYRLLLSHGASVDSISKEDLLCSAVARGRFLSTLILLQTGDNPNATGCRSPLHEACAKGHIDIVKLFLQKSSLVDILDEEGNTPLHEACFSGYLSIVELLLRKSQSSINLKNFYGATPLCRAVSKKHFHLTKVLLGNGADPNIPNAYGETPLHFACNKFGHIESAKLLLEAGAFVNAKSVPGSTPLHWAAALGKKEIVGFLLEQGAEIDAVNARGKTALYRAVQTSQHDVVELLLRRGCDAALRDVENCSAMDVARNVGDDFMVLLLKKYCAPENGDVASSSPIVTSSERASYLENEQHFACVWTFVSAFFCGCCYRK